MSVKVDSLHHLVALVVFYAERIRKSINGAGSKTKCLTLGVNEES
jgi:hypothetical protein